MEPVNFWPPAAGFLEGVKEVAHEHGALLIFDEICSGFHFGLGGAQKKFGVTPDLACFGKAIGNGFPISCMVGRAGVMKVFEDIFFSFTFGGEVASMAAAMKVLDVLEGTDALARMNVNGRVLQEGLNALAKRAGLQGRIQCRLSILVVDKVSRCRRQGQFSVAKSVCARMRETRSAAAGHSQHDGGARSAGD